MYVAFWKLRFLIFFFSHALLLEIVSPTARVQNEIGCVELLDRSRAPGVEGLFTEP